MLGDGPVGAGTKIRETLEVSGKRRTFEEEIVSYDAPTAASSRFKLEGIAVESASACSRTATAPRA